MTPAITVVKEKGKRDLESDVKQILHDVKRDLSKIQLSPVYKRVRNEEPIAFADDISSVHYEEIVSLIELVDAVLPSCKRHYSETVAVAACLEEGERRGLKAANVLFELTDSSLLSQVF
jgi:hypothetical protein